MAIIPNTNVRLAENIRDVLNSAGGSVTNDIITFFQDRAKINKWSIFKPVPLSDNDPYDRWDWFKGNDGKCGLDVYATSSMSAMANYVLGNSESARWKYVAPRGGVDEPLRCGDFKGYDTEAIKPLYSLTSYKGTHIRDVIKLRLYYKYNTSNPSLFFDKIKINGGYLMDWYLGAIFVNQSTNAVLGGACNQYSIGDPRDLEYNFGTEYDPFVIPLANYQEAFESLTNYIMIPVFMERKHSLFFYPNEVGSNDLFVDLPIGNGSVYFYAIKDVGFYTADKLTYYNSRGINFELYAENKTNQSVDLGGFVIELWEYDPYYPGDENMAMKIYDVAYESRSYIPANVTDYETRIGGFIEWDTYEGHKISEDIAYENGYFLKLVGDNPQVFPTFVSRRISKQ